MKVVYLIQTHKNPEQINRLVQTIKKSSPQSHISIGHDFTNCHLDSLPLQMPGVNVIEREAVGIRGDFSLVQAYLDAVAWLFERDIDFDWLINLSGQDYPTQSLSLFEQFLSETEFDGFLQHRNVLLKNGYYGKRESSNRYFYQYRHLGIELTPWQRALLKPLRVLVNNTQPFVRMDTSYQLSIGLRAFSNPFDREFACYGGSYFKILSQKCVRYLYDYYKQNPDLVDYYKKTRNPDESYIQTVLANSGQFNFCDDYKFYIDWAGSRHGHPRILTVDDYPVLTQNNIYFARKFDTARDSKILDMLDARILEGKLSYV